MRPSLEVLSGTLAALNYLQCVGTQSNDPLAEAGGGVTWRIPNPLIVQGAAVNDVTAPLPTFTTGTHTGAARRTGRFHGCRATCAQRALPAKFPLAQSRSRSCEKSKLDMSGVKPCSVQPPST